MRIAVVGSGYVGLVAGACFADLGHDVILVDNDQPKLAALTNGQVPIHEKFLPELLTRHRGQRLTFSDDLKEAVRLSSVIFACSAAAIRNSSAALFFKRSCRIASISSELFPEAQTMKM